MGDYGTRDGQRFASSHLHCLDGGEGCLESRSTECRQVDSRRGARGSKFRITQGYFALRFICQSLLGWAGRTRARPGCKQKLIQACQSQGREIWKIRGVQPKSAAPIAVSSPTSSFTSSGGGCLVFLAQPLFSGKVLRSSALKSASALNLLVFAWIRPLHSVPLGETLEISP